MWYRMYLLIGIACAALVGCDSGSGAAGEGTTDQEQHAPAADGPSEAIGGDSEDATAAAGSQQVSGWPAHDEGDPVHGHDVPEVLNSEGCFACHALKAARIGPPYQAIAARYRSDDGAAERLTRKIIDGGGGAWGPVPMISHPHLGEDEARHMVDLILDMAPKA